MLDTKRLAELVDAFDPAAHADEIMWASQELEQLLERFPRSAWPEMTLDAYALGQQDHPESYCWWMEFGAKHLGSIKGGNAKKHLIYFQAAGQWWFDEKLYGSVDEAWRTVRGGFVEALDRGDAGEFEVVDTLAPLKSGPALVTKTMHVYFPDEILPICSAGHLRHLLAQLGEPRSNEPGLGTVTLNRILLEGLRSSGLVDGWSTKEMERLMYSSGIDPFVEPLQTGPISDPSAFIRSVLADSDDRLQARRASEDQARALLDQNAGSMSEPQFREMLRLFNLDFHDGKPAGGRFGTGFTGHTANGLVAHLDLVNDFTKRAWRGTDGEAIAAANSVLSNRKSLPSAGSSYPSMLLYLRYPDERAVWIPSTDAGLRRLTRYGPRRTAANGGPEEYEEFNEQARELMERHEIPPELLDLVLWAAGTAKNDTSVQTDDAVHDEPEGAVTEDVRLPPVSQDAARKLFLPRDWLQNAVVDLLVEKRQVIFFGPPGTGKTFVAQRLAQDLTRDGGSWDLIQFHPSYSYEDFFEGYRPRREGDVLTYALTWGPLRRMADAAKADPGRPYVLVVDEINRGNVAKIFGELLFLLEYRDRAIALQYSPDEQFSLPRNLLIIGTMNTADRSIALVDSALRRRFYFVEFSPTVAPVRDVLGQWLTEHHLDEEPARLLTELNRRMDSREFAIGPSYFMTADASEPNLERIWEHAIVPLLEEHFYGTERDVRDEFGLETLRRGLSSDAELSEEEETSEEEPSPAN